jgi:hypothetical protein
MAAIGAHSIGGKQLSRVVLYTLRVLSELKTQKFIREKGDASMLISYREETCRDAFKTATRSRKTRRCFERGAAFPIGA